MGIPFNRGQAPRGGSLGIPSAQFRETVRAALGRQSGPPAEPYNVLTQELPEIDAQAQSVRQRITNERTELLEQLAETAGLRGWNVQRCEGAEDGLDYVASLVRRLGVRSVARSEQPVFDTVPVDVAIAGAGGLCWPAVYDGPASRNDVRQRLAESGMGITGADYAIAETGSVVVQPRQGLSRLVSVVPPVHVAIVRPSDIVGTLDDLFTLRRLEYVRSGGEMGSYLNFITGPSRTADIEQTIVVGVHGPREVHMVLLNKE